MRDLAAEAGADPASFTRLAKALGYSGWDELARRPDRGAPARAASPFSGRTKGAAPRPQRRCIAGRRQTRSRSGRPCAASRRARWPAPPRRCMRRGGSGSPAFEAAAAWRNCSIINFACSGPTRCNWSAARAPRISTSAPSSAGDAVVVIGFAPYSTASVLSARAAHRFRRHADRDRRHGRPRRWRKAPTSAAVEAASSPGFFPSLTGAIAIAQSLAAVTFVLGGAAAKRRLEETEVRLAAMSQYVAEKG